MMLYKNTKVKVRSPDEDTNFFDIVVGVLQEDALAIYLFIICQDYVLERRYVEWENTVLHQKKKTKSRQHSAQTITDADYADDIALQANTPTQAESLLRSLEQPAGCIGHHTNVEKNRVHVFQ